MKMRRRGENTRSRGSEKNDQQKCEQHSVVGAAGHRDRGDRFGFLRWLTTSVPCSTPASSVCPFVFVLAYFFSWVLSFFFFVSYFEISADRRNVLLPLLATMSRRPYRVSARKHANRHS